MNELEKEMLQALKDAAELVQLARTYFPRSIRNAHRFHLENINANSILKAIAKAEAAGK